MMLVRAYRMIHTSNYTQAITDLETFQKTSVFGRNEIFDVVIGQCYLHNGDRDIALKYLTRAHGKNIYLQNGLTSLAYIFTSKEDVHSLEKLIANVQPTEYSAEHWYVVASQHYVQRKYDKATYFAHKACYMNPTNVDAAILNGKIDDFLGFFSVFIHFSLSAKIFLKIKKYNEAIALLRNLLNHSPNRLEIYDKLLSAYRATNRLREAQLIATEAVRVIGKTPRTYLVSLNQSTPISLFNIIFSYRSLWPNHI